MWNIDKEYNYTMQPNYNMAVYTMNSVITWTGLRLGSQMLTSLMYKTHKIFCVIKYYTIFLF